MKYLNIKQDIKEIFYFFKLFKDKVKNFVKNHLLFKQGLKSFFIIFKWIILPLLIIYSFLYTPYLWKKLKIIKYHKNIISSEQKLQNCINANSTSYCLINLEIKESDENLVYSINDSSQLSKNPKMIAGNSKEEFSEYVKQVNQYQNKLSKQIKICNKRATILEKENDSPEKQEIFENLFSVLSSFSSKEYYNYSGNYRDPDYFKKRLKIEEEYKDLNYKIKNSRQMLFNISEMKNKCTINELKNELHYYQKDL